MNVLNSAPFSAANKLYESVRHIIYKYEKRRT